MEILIAIAPILIVGVVSYFIISIQEWITDVRFYRRKTRKELERIRRSLSRVTLPIKEAEKFERDKQKTDTVRYEEMGATLSEAERLIKEARDRTIG